VPTLDGLASCDLVLIASPPSTIAAVLRALEPIVNETCVLTDVASVKGVVAASVPLGLEDRFVPGHPLAGTEVSGPGMARADLFHGAAWVLCPDEATQPWARERVLGMVRSLRALPVWLSAEEHDRHVAILSHLPHVLAATLLIQSESLKHPDIGGGSWRDLTRVGGAAPELWTDILRHNRHAMLAALGSARELLDEFEKALKADDEDMIRALILRAAKAKRRER